jgi:hypothetical protein
MTEMKNSSYKDNFRLAFKLLIGSFLLSFLVYLKNKSLEASFGVFAFLSSITIMCLIGWLLNTYHINNRGNEK